MVKTKECPACGRTDVPVCQECGSRVPHGFTVGTSLPCNCKELKNEDTTSK